MPVAMYNRFPFTLDPGNVGQTNWTTGEIDYPEALQGISTAALRKLTLDLAYTINYVGKGGASDVYINGTNPAASYTPVTPIIILGPEGIEVETLAVTGRSRRRPPMFLADTDQVVDVSMANRFILADNPAASRIIEIRQSTAPIPEEGDWMQFLLKAGSPGFAYDIRREGSSDTIAFVAGYVGVEFAPVTIEIQLEGGVWRLTAAGQGSAFGADA